MDRYCKEIEEDLRKKIDDTEKFIEAWKKVEFVTKKDGSPYANLGKNIRNAHFFSEDYSIKGVDNKLRVYTSEHGSIGDDILCYHTLHKYDRNYQKAIDKPYNVKSRGPYLNDAYVFDLEDIKEAVSYRIEYLTNLLREYREQLSSTENAYNNFLKGYETLIENLKKDSGCDGKNKNHLYYSIMKEVTESHRF